MTTTIQLGELTLRRLGYGAMRLPGEGVWGEPENPEAARAVLRRAVELGVQLIDTSWFYGPWVSNRLIVEALHPYPRDLVIATKLGAKRLADKSWAPDNRPEQLKAAHEADLKSLKLEQSDLTHFRALPHSEVPFEDSFGALVEMQKKGLIRRLAVSNVTVAQLQTARRMAEVVAVQNVYSVAHSGERRAPMHGPAPTESPDDVLDLCTSLGIAFLPFFPLAMGALGKGHPAINAIAEQKKVTPAQLSIAWLLGRSKMMLPIPGTKSVAHLEENWAAQQIALTPSEMSQISG
jgi:pyridoxine 4-dehydrogenase